MRILDVGGGYGRISGPLAETHDVTLCDISPEMLEEAQARWQRLTLVEADARKLPFAQGEFDAVVALDLVAHLPELRPGIEELARVTRVGGDLVFDTSNASPWWVLAYPRYVGPHPWRLVQTMLGGGVLPEWQDIVHHHRPAAVRAALGAGLLLHRVQRFGPPWTAKWHLWWTTRIRSGPA